VTTVPALRLRTIASPNVRFLLDAFPIPTGPEAGTSGRAPFVGAYSDQSTLNATSFRIDHNFSDRLSVFGRFNYAPSQSIIRPKSTTSPPNNPVAVDLKVMTLTFGATQTLSAKTFNEMRFNYSRSSGERASFIDNFGGAIPVSIEQLVPAFALETNAVAQVSFSPGTILVGRGNDNLQRQINLVDNLTLTKAAHVFKFGVDYRRLSPVRIGRGFLSAAFLTTDSAISNGLVSLGFVQSQKRTEPVFTNFSTYFQDTWQTSKRLTLTYGLRWDVNPPPRASDGQQPWALTSSDPLTAQIAPEGTPLWKTSWANFAPRVGFSYQLSQSPGRELVVRGGVGLFYDLGNTSSGDAFSTGPFTASSPFFFNQSYPLPITSSTIPSFPVNGIGVSANVVDPQLKQPYTWQWNLTFQQALGTNQTISAAYVAALGRQLLRPRLINGLNPNFRLLQYADNASSSDYHSLQLQFVRRLSRNFQALASYTWAHSIDDISDETGSFTSIRGNSDFDVRHNFSSALQYNSPWNNGGVTGTLVRGWQASIIIHAQSAYPFMPNASSLSNLAGLIVTQWPNLVAGVPLEIPDPTAPGGRRFNRAAFAAPSAGTQGNLGRNVLRGFPTFQTDFALQRTFSLSEDLKLTFRGEAFNLFNHPNFGLPVPDINNPLFGQSNQLLGRNLGGLSPVFQIGGPRSIQLGLRLSF
jgi:hypothetical protein